MGAVRTEDELLCWRKHVQGERDFILVVLLRDPIREVCRVLRQEERQDRNRNASYNGPGQSCWIGKVHGVYVQQARELGVAHKTCRTVECAHLMAWW